MSICEVSVTSSLLKLHITSANSKLACENGDNIIMQSNKNICELVKYYPCHISITYDGKEAIKLLVHF